MDYATAIFLRQAAPFLTWKQYKALVEMLWENMEKEKLCE